MNLVVNAYPDTGLGVLPDLDLELSLHVPTEAPIWHSIVGSARLAQGFSTKRGRDKESDRFKTGDAVWTLDNRDRKYDPLHTTSPLYGHIKPNRRVRMLARYNSITYVVFDGYVDGFEQHYDPPREATAVVKAGDGQKILAQADLPDSFYDLVVANDKPDHWFKLSEPVGATLGIDSGTGASWAGVHVNGVTLGATGIIPYGGSATAATYDGTNDYSQFSGDIASSGTTFSTEIWFSIADESAGTYYLQAAVASISPLHFVNLSVDSTGGSEGKLVMTVYKSGASVGSTTSTARVDDSQPHHAVVSSTSLTSVSLYLDGALVGTVSEATAVTAVNPFSIVIGTYWKGTAQSLSFWDGRALSATEALAHYNAGDSALSGEATGTRASRYLDALPWPSGDRDIDTGSSTVGSFDLNGNSTLDGLGELDDTEQGQSYMGLDAAMSSDHTFKYVRRARHSKFTAARTNTSQVTFTSSMYADVLIDYDEQGIYNEAVVTRRDGSPQTAKDVDSQGEYFKRTYTKSTIDASDTQAFDHATYVVNRRSDPQFRIVGLVIKPQRSASTLWPQVLGREIGDRITVQLTPQQVGTQISREAVIEGVEHSMKSGEWTTVWRLSEADTTIPWILDDTTYSVLDSTTILAF